MPNLLTNFLLKAYASVIPLTPTSAPVVYRRIYASIIAIYLAFSVYDAYYSVKYEYSGSFSDLYNLLGVTPTSSIDEIRKVYRRYSVVNHPDKAHNSNDAKYTLVVQAYELLRDKDFRYLYDRLGPQAISWYSQDKHSIAEGVLFGARMIGQYYIVYYISLQVAHFLGYAKSAMWWRYLVATCAAVVELSFLVHSTFPLVLGLLPYQQVQVIRRLLVSITVGLNQIIPLFSDKQYMDEDLQLKAQVEELTSLTKQVELCSRNVLKIEYMAADSTDKSMTEAAIRSSWKAAQLHGDPLVKDAMNEYSQRASTLTETMESEETVEI